MKYKIFIFGLIVVLILSTIQISALQLSRNEIYSGKNTTFFINNPYILSTFLGGENNDGMYYTGVNIIQDNQGNYIIAGTTESTDFPITNNALYPDKKGDSDIFITKINNDFTEILASTYFGGSNKEEARGIEIDQNGNIFICGITESSDFPETTNGLQSEYNGGTEAPYGSGDAFIVKMNNNLDVVLAATFLGGTGHESCNSISIDSNGDIIISGSTSSSDFPVSENAYDTNHNSGGYFRDDVFLTKISNDLSEMISSTYVGGNHDDFSEAISVDSSDNIFISGWTRSSNYPTTDEAFDVSFGGIYDGFITKFNEDMTDVISSTYLGGTQWDFCYALDLDNYENIYVTGHTASLNYPTTSDVYCRNYQGAGGANVGDDAFISKLSNNLSLLLASTYLGGDNWESGLSLEVSTNDMIYVAGTTSSVDFPVINSFTDTYNGGVTHYGDMFISCLNNDLSMLPASTYLGGSIDENSGQIILDEIGDIIISGTSSSPDFPIVGVSFDNTHNGDADVFLTKFKQGLSDNNPPDKPILSGPESGKSEELYGYSAITNDFENDEIHYIFDWGDGTDSGWIGPISSGEECLANYSWNENGDYSIKVKAKDDKGMESEWSDPLIISVPKSKIIQSELSTNDLSWTKHRISNEFGSASSLITCDINEDDNIDFVGTSWDLKQICWWYYDYNTPFNWNKKVKKMSQI
ncbi:SBBP repeat-containing protein [Thermoplasmatota archaeon]